MRVIAACDNCVDIYINLNRFYPTGNGIDFAINLKNNGADVSVLTIFGNDGYALSVKELLRSWKIPYYGQELEKPSAEAIMSLVNGDRKHVHFSANVMHEFRLSEDDFERILTFDIIYTEKWTKPWTYGAKVKKPNNTRIHDFSAKFSKETYELLLPYIDYAFFSFPKYSDEVISFLRDARSQGPHVVIGMLGTDGSIAYDGNRTWRVEAQKVPVINTVGAGDSYIAGFTTGLLAGKDTISCMQLGCELASQVVQIFEPYPRKD